MNIQYIHKNLIKAFLDNEVDVIIHGCNCFNTMGAGIALEIKNTFPEAYEADLKTIKGDKNKLGSYSFSVINRNKYYPGIIYNAYTQYNYRDIDKSKTLFDYDAFSNVLEKIKTDLIFNQTFHNKIQPIIGMPKIGAGLAKGNWDIIENIIDKTFFSTTENLLYYKDRIIIYYL